MRACSVGKSVDAGCGLGADAGEAAGGGLGCSTVLPSCLAGGGKNLALVGTVTDSVPVAGDLPKSGGLPEKISRALSGVPVADKLVGCGLLAAQLRELRIRLSLNSP